MKKIDKIIYDYMSEEEQIRWVLRPKGGQEYEKKRELIKKISRK